jgi:hypothetical protein
MSKGRTLDQAIAALPPERCAAVKQRTAQLIGEELARRPEKIALAEKLAKFANHFDPKIVSELNGQHEKLVPGSDREGRGGEFIIVPRGVEHCPKAEREVAVMLFEPASTVNTGKTGGETTVEEPEWI